MYEKFILTIKSENPEEIKFFTIRDIAKYLKLPYHEVRAIWLESNEKTKKKFNHPHTKILLSKFEIKDNLERYNV